MHVFKIDASVLFNQASMDSLIHLCKKRRDPCIFVLAAPQQMQQLLDTITAIAPEDAEEAEILFQEFQHAYRELCAVYMLDDSFSNYITEQTRNLHDLVSGVTRIRECSPRSTNCIRSYAVELATRLYAGVLQKHAVALKTHSSSDYILFDSIGGNVLLDETYARLKHFPSNTAKIHCVSGGLGCVQANDAIVCNGAQGADLTASIFAVSQGAKTLTLLGLRPGLFVADPSLVQGAPIITELSMEEALEITYFDERTIHSQALIPLEGHPIDVYINSVHQHDTGGTWIRWKGAHSKTRIRGISVIQNLALVLIEGRGMRGVQGMASGVFSALARESISVTMITQTASEQSICIVCKMAQASQAKHSLENALHKEITGHRISRISVTVDMAVIGAVGSNMRGQHGIAGTIFACLGDAEINVIAIAQAASESNISFVVDMHNVQKATQALYTTFFHAST